MTNNFIASGAAYISGLAIVKIQYNFIKAFIAITDARKGFLSFCFIISRWRFDSKYTG